MKDFTYEHPTTVEDAVALGGSGTTGGLYFAGGTDLLGLVKDGVVSPERLVDLKKIKGMGGIEVLPGRGLRLGALVTLAELARHPEVRQRWTVLAEAAGSAASPQLRNVGTLGGNLCQRPRCWYFRGAFDCLKKGGDRCFAEDGENRYHCVIGGGPCHIVHPSDTAVALTALDAVLVVAGPDGERLVPVREFFILPDEDFTRETILGPGEIVTAVEVPEPAGGTKSAYVKIRERESFDFAVASVAAVLVPRARTLMSGAVAFGGIAPVPWLEKAVSAKLAGFKVSAENLDNLADSALAGAEPLEQNAYKVTLARNLLKKAVRELMA